MYSYNNKHINNNLFFKYQIQEFSFQKQHLIIKTKHKSQRRLRSPHADKRGLDQFDKFIYKIK